MEDVPTGADQRAIKEPINRTPLFQGNAAQVKSGERDPLRKSARRDDEDPDQRNPQGAGEMFVGPNISPIKEKNKTERQEGRENRRHFNPASLGLVRQRARLQKNREFVSPHIRPRRLPSLER